MESQNGQIDPSLDTSAEQDTGIGQQPDTSAAADAGVSQEPAELVQDGVNENSTQGQSEGTQDQSQGQGEQSSGDQANVSTDTATATLGQDTKVKEELVVEEEEEEVPPTPEVKAEAPAPKQSAPMTKIPDVPALPVKTIGDIFSDTETEEAYKLAQLETSGKTATRVLISTVRRILKNTAPGRPMGEKEMNLYQLELLNALDAALRADYDEFKEAWGAFITFFVIAEKQHKEKKYTALHERYILRSMNHWPKGTESSLALAHLVALARLSIDPKLRGKTLTKEVSFDNLGKGYLSEEARQQFIKFYGV